MDDTCDPMDDSRDQADDSRDQADDSRRNPGVRVSSAGTRETANDSA
ncbi:hypothetical protein [Amycolatopsis sp. WAC 01375]|nr:hypothetical protein [Amycolatopsis sp. WAC 01375]